MAFCGNCGAEVQGKFCAKCGSAVAAAAGGAGPSPQAPAQAPVPQAYTAPPQSYTAPPQNYPQQPQQGSASPAQATGMADNVASTLCYVLGLVTGVLFLVLEPYNKNRAIRFHAFQSIFLHVASIAAFIALMVVGGILTVFLRMIPFLGVLVSFVLYPMVGFAFFVLWVLLMYKAYNNERWVLPIIGELAEKQA